MISKFSNIKNIKIFSSNMLLTFEYRTKKIKKLSDLLSKQLTKMDNGVEVGSANYIKNSPYIFIKAKASQKNYFTISLQKECFEYIRPQVFVKQNLKKGDLIISKDSNVGETCILAEDMPKAMLSTAFYKLSFKENKLYFLAFSKTSFFRRQFDLLVPKGATIKHAGRKFLDAIIPFPREDKDVKFVEYICGKIIDIENKIKLFDNHILEFVEKELIQNHGIPCNNINNTVYSMLLKEKRLDTGLYLSKYNELEKLIQNYTNGFINLSNDKVFNISRGQNLQISNIGKSFYSNYLLENSSILILSNSITDYMTFRIEKYLGTQKKVKQIKKGDIILSCRGNLGKCFVFCSKNLKAITNIDNVHIQYKQDVPLYKKIATLCYFHFLQKKDYFKNISIQGSGADSFTKYHFEKIKVPNFSENFCINISKLYYNSEIYNDINSSNLLEIRINELGIYQLELLKGILVQVIENSFFNIINNQIIDIESKFKNILQQFIFLTEE